MQLYQQFLIGLILAMNSISNVSPSELARDQPKFPKTYIGVITQPNTEYKIYTKNTNGTFSEENSYIASSYVKYVEQTGAVALLIPYDLPLEELNAVMNQTNGILFPGGAAALLNRTSETPTPYMNRINYMVQYAKQRNDAGQFFSIWGECLGFEEMVLSLSNLDPSNLMPGFDDVNQVHPTKVTDKFFKRSRLFGLMDYYESMYFFGRDSMWYHHVMGITPEKFMSDPVLKKTMDIVGTSVAPNGKEYVAIMQHKKYPFYGLQSHPEKSQFEKKNPSTDIIDRQKETLDVSSNFIRAFVEENRMKRKYEIDSVGLSTKGQAYLAYNFLQVPFLGTTFESIFMFGKMSDCGEECDKFVSSDDYTDSVYETYKNVRAAKKVYDSEQKVSMGNPHLDLGASDLLPAFSAYA